MTFEVLHDGCAWVVLNKDRVTVYRSQNEDDCWEWIDGQDDGLTEAAA